MKILRWIAVSFSLYSAIPMPHFKWKEEDMSKSLCFFPLVGAVIGGLVYGINRLHFINDLPLFVRTLLTVIIPIVVTGGFHLDGFMDTKDALHSYLPRERKLEILKDPHIGAFAVIHLLVYLMVYCAAVGVILGKGKRNFIIIFALSFVLSRSLSGITSLRFKKAKKEGMLSGETGGKNNGIILFLTGVLVITLIAMAFRNPFVAGITAILQGAAVLYYRHMAYKEFGGVTGDTAGFLLCISEAVTAVIVALFSIMV